MYFICGEHGDDGYPPVSIPRTWREVVQWGRHRQRKGEKDRDGLCEREGEREKERNITCTPFRCIVLWPLSVFQSLIPHLSSDLVPHTHKLRHVNVVWKLFFINKMKSNQQSIRFWQTNKHGLSYPSTCQNTLLYFQLPCKAQHTSSACPITSRDKVIITPLWTTSDLLTDYLHRRCSYVINTHT